MATVGGAEVPVAPIFPGFQNMVRKEMLEAGRKGSADFTKETQRQGIGARVASGMRKGLIGGVAAVGAAAGGALSASLFKGFDRLKNIENAQAKLLGLGHSAETVKAIMNDALGAVQGTAFGLDEAAKVAASTVAAGIKPGKELQGVLKLVADAATIGGTSMSEMGSIFNKVATANKIDAEVFNQLSDRGIPIMSLLAKSMGKTTAEVIDMRAAGEINFEMFRKAMEEGMGGAALESGNTTIGAFKNVGAAMGRFGATLLKGAFPQFKTVLQSLMQGIDRATKAVGPFAEVLGAKVAAVLERVSRVISDLANGGLANLVARFRELAGGGLAQASPLIQTLQGALPPLLANIQPIGAAFRELGKAIGGAVATLLPTLLSVVTSLVPVVGGLAAGIAAVVPHLVGMVSAFIQFVTPALQSKELIGAIVAGFLIYQGVLAVSAARTLALAAATVIYQTVMKAVRIATMVAAAAQWVLNAALSANPIGIIIVAVAALVAGLIYFFTQTELGKQIITNVWNAIQTAVGAVVTFFQTVVFPVVTSILTAIGDAALWLWNNAIMPAFNFIKGAITAVGNVFMAIWNGFLRPVFELFGAIVKWLWEKAIKVAFTAIQLHIKVVSLAIRTVYNTIIKPVIDAFGAIVRWLWNNVVQPVMRFIQDRWREVATGMRVIHQNVIKPVLGAVGDALNVLKGVFDRVVTFIKRVWQIMSTDLYNKAMSIKNAVFGALQTGVDAVKGAFDTAVKGIKTIWDGLQDIAKKPVKFVVETVLNNGLIAGFNKLAETFGTTKIDPIVLPKGFADGGIFMRNRYTPGKDIGYAALSGYESIMRPEFTKAMGESWVYGANRAAREGGVSGVRRYLGAFRDGGVAPVPGQGNRHTSGYPWATWAGDYPVPTNTPVLAWKDGIVQLVRALTYSYGKHIRINHTDGTSSLYAHLNSFAVKVGDAVKAGQRIAYSDSTGKSTGPHLHFETKGGPFNGGSDGGGGFDLIGQVTQFKDAILNKVKDIAGQFGDNPFVKMLTSLPNKIISGAVDKLTGLAGSIFDAAKGAGQWIGEKLSGGKGRNAAKAAALKLGASSVDFHKDPRGYPSWDMMSSGATNSRIAEAMRANHDQFAIRYVISQMRIASAKSGWNWRRYEPISSSGDWRHDNHVHTSHYANGTLNAKRGLGWVGEREPELLRFRGGEEVWNSEMLTKAAGGARGPQKISGTLDLGNGLKGLVRGVLEDATEDAEVSF